MTCQTGAATGEFADWDETLGAGAGSSPPDVCVAQLRLPLTVASAIPKIPKATGETFTVSARLAFDTSAMSGFLFELANKKIGNRLSAGLGALMILGAGLAGYMLPA